MSRKKIPARPTIYEGIQMRSRLEAQFAQILDGFECDWAYEPDCYANRDGQYLPDFRVDGSSGPWYVEVKPYLELGDADLIFKKMQPIADSFDFVACPYDCTLAIATPELGSLMLVQSWINGGDDRYIEPWSGLGAFFRDDDGIMPRLATSEGTCFAYDLYASGLVPIDWPYPA